MNRNTTTAINNSRMRRAVKYMFEIRSAFNHNMPKHVRLTTKKKVLRRLARQSGLDIYHSFR